MAKWVNTENLQPVLLDDLRLDQDVCDQLRGYKLYRDDKSYIFVLIRYDNRYFPYYIHRYIAGLTHTTHIRENRRLPTVDHINRDASDNRRCNLRWCTRSQNNFNQIDRKPKRFKGVGKNNSFYICTDYKHLCDKAKLWMNILFCVPSFGDNYATDQADLTYLSLRVQDLRPHVNVTMLDDFTRDILRVLQKTNINYRWSEHLIYKWDMPDEDYDDLPCLRQLRSQMPMSIKKRNSLPGEYGEILAALHHDVCKYSFDKVFALMNFISVTPPFTCESCDFDRSLSVIDVLNLFANEMDDWTVQNNSVCDDRLAQRWTYVRNTDGGVHDIVALDCDVSMVADSILMPLQDKYIVSPYVMYSLKNM